MFEGSRTFRALRHRNCRLFVAGPATVVVGGSVCIVAAAYFARRLPELRDEARALVAAQPQP
ncbi:MAG TPA: hypothetical protein VHH90_08980 [Polyangia bacterium]|nr:hypothetical protein [Polyangia bacterium]